MRSNRLLMERYLWLRTRYSRLINQVCAFRGSLASAQKGTNRRRFFARVNFDCPDRMDATPAQSIDAHGRARGRSQPEPFPHDG